MNRQGFEVKENMCLHPVDLQKLVLKDNWQEQSMEKT